MPLICNVVPKRPLAPVIVTPDACTEKTPLAKFAVVPVTVVPVTVVNPAVPPVSVVNWPVFPVTVAPESRVV